MITTKNCTNNLFYLIIVYASILSFSITVSNPNPIGVDIYEHMQYAKYWLPFNATSILHNPYPPLFYWILLPSIHLNVPYDFARMLQILCYPLAITSTMIFVKKHIDEKSALFAGFMLLSSYAFFDRTIQAQPQALDFVLLPIFLDCLLSEHKKGFMLTSILLLLNHAPISLFAIAGALFLVAKKKWEKQIAPIIVMIAALAFVWITTRPDWFINNLFLAQNAQETAFWGNPLFYIVWHLGVLALGFPITILVLIYRKKMDDLTLLLLLTVASVSIMSVVWADRWIQYLAIPFSMLLSFKYPKKYRILLVPFMILGFIIPWFYLYLGMY